MSTSNQTKNSIDAAFAKWNAQEATYVEDYGKKIYHNRDFIKARKEALEKIYNEHKGKKLNFHEKISLSLLKGEIKETNRALYPNPTIRTLKAVGKLLSRPLSAPFKWGANFLSILLRGRPAFNQKPARVQPMRAPQMRIVPKREDDKQKNNSQKAAAPKKQQPVQRRKLPTKPRVTSSDTTSQKMRR